MSQSQVQSQSQSQSPSASGSGQIDPISQGIQDLYLESYAFTTSAAIVGSVDRKVFVLLRDGRNLFGILRTFDQYANLVLQDTVERIYLPDNKYSEADRGVFLIRGENVVMLGEIDIDKEDLPLEKWNKTNNFKDAEEYLKNKNNEKIGKEVNISKKMGKIGLTSDFTKTDLY
ncbi:hypothetical protein PACTADRAFT_16555 [Pachysolen tannophilus NRRL Y-2460]|uniref:U6 snRNA-associated Sm-like protein LSm1 n=1 Tax=Pachysolen tannophilus NRRL Y-2460 TaxID=669874 RepID=A0A1E4TXI1_PACTA|nr:hypothetical protein PACTADRAFT_16555 [Pachysolen tannophilus NRRL Y-2460]